MKNYQSSDSQVASLNGADLECCQVVVQEPGYLSAARAWSTNIVTTGTVTVTLKWFSLNGAAGGIEIDVLENIDLEDYSSTLKVYEFDIPDAIQGFLFGKWSHFFLHLDGNNAADRFDRPVLDIDWTPADGS